MAEGKLPVDENHSTDLAAPGGDPSPARGWIVSLESRGDDPRTGGVWGQVEWTKSGIALMNDKAYRGISPVFVHEKDGRVTRLLRAALTNTPNLTQLASLHTRLTAEERKALPAEMFAVPAKRELIIRDPDHVELAWGMVDRTQGLTATERAEARRRILARAKTLGMDTSGWSKAAHAKGADMDISQIREALGLPETADEAACLAAMKEGHDKVALQARQIEEHQRQIADHGKKSVPLEQFVALQSQVSTLEGERARDRAVRYVDDAIKAGKPIAADAVRDRMIALHMDDPAATEGMISSMPSINARGSDGKFKPAPQEGAEAAMSAEDRDVMRRFGLNAEQMVAWRKKQREQEAA